MLKLCSSGTRVPLSLSLSHSLSLARSLPCRPPLCAADRDSRLSQRLSVTPSLCECPGLAASNCPSTVPPPLGPTSSLSTSQSFQITTRLSFSQHPQHSKPALSSVPSFISFSMLSSPAWSSLLSSNLSCPSAFLTFI